MRRDRDRFEEWVREALEGLPREFRCRIGHVEVLIQEEPTRAQLRAAGLRPGDTLFGLYEGVPLTERAGEMPPLLPDRVVLFRRPLLRHCRSAEELREEVRRTLLHELAHCFGIDDDRLEELGAY